MINEDPIIQIPAYLNKKKNVTETEAPVKFNAAEPEPTLGPVDPTETDAN